LSNCSSQINKVITKKAELITERNEKINKCISTPNIEFKMNYWKEKERKGSRKFDPKENQINVRLFNPKQS
jgi:hypothetical protein